MGIAGSRAAWVAIIGAGLALAGCGETLAPNAIAPGQDTGDLVIEQPVGATPGVTEDVAIDTEATIVSIVNGKLSPVRIEGLAGSGFTLEVRGDGTQRIIAIDGLLDPDIVKPDGITTFQFDVDGTPQDLNITLDEKNAGIFTVMDPGGLSDE